jgi:diguanylate cyclase (GGDEF)-like protein
VATETGVTGSARRATRNAWWIFAVAGSLLSLAPLATPPTAIGVALFLGVQAAGLAALVVGVRWLRPPAPLAWWLLIAGRACWLATSASWKLHTLQFGHPPPQWVSYGFLVQFPLLAVALALIASRRDGQRKSHGAIDAAIITGGLSVLGWTFVVEPFVQVGPMTSLQFANAMLYAACDLTVLAGLVRLLVLGGRPNATTLLLSAGTLALLAADVVFYVTTFSGGHTLTARAMPNVLWQLWAVLTAAAALHPTLGKVEQRRRRAADGLIPRWQLGAFIMLALLVPAVPVAAGLRERYVVPVIIAAGVSVLLVIRLGVVVQVANRRAVELQRSLGQREALERELHHRATHDPLSGLANRALLVEALDRALERRERLAMLLLDLDGFKDVNDTLGHPAGDELLIEVSRRLRAALPAVDLLARLGGDEFAALWHPDEETPEAVGERALACLRPAYQITGRDIHLTGSVGLLVLGDQRTSSDALRDADLALYAAKDAGKNQVSRFEPGLRAARARHSELTAGLRRAVAEDELSVHYQPVVHLGDGRITAVEALLRWNPAGGAPVPPTTFIPVAEETGLIVPIGWLALRRACADARRWYTDQGICVTVNVSGYQLREPDFVDTVLAVLADEGLPGRALVLELTETTLITNLETTERLDRLRGHGVRVAVDDFGTGYSSLSYLVQLPVDILKIDRAFTGPPGQPAAHHWAFTRAILDLANSLELDTIAEGVETDEQERILRALNCPYAQGYRYSRPVPAGQIDELLARWQPRQEAWAGSAL